MDKIIIWNRIFEELDDNKLNPLNKPVAVWGTGVRAASFIKDNRLYEIEFLSILIRNRMFGMVSL